MRNGAIAASCFCRESLIKIVSILPKTGGLTAAGRNSTLPDAKCAADDRRILRTDEARTVDVVLRLEKKR
jgi:hypothetical protein